MPTTCQPFPPDTYRWHASRIDLARHGLCLAQVDKKFAMKFAACLAVSCAMLLTACSGMRLVDSDVTAYATGPTIPAGAGYRFERLPSQQATPQQSAALESLAEAALAKVGLQRNDAAAQYAVQLELRLARDPRAPWDDPREVDGYFGDMPIGPRHGSLLRRPSFRLNYDPYYRREVALVVRRLSDSQLVFETRAKHDGRWPDDEAVLAAMLQAALQGFPNPAAGVRRVVLEIPR